MDIKTKGLKETEYTTDLCVIGGGLAGVIAAISAARAGAKVVLIQDRPVLGGNASSEIRMGVRGARGLENKETGILSELELENIYRNPNLNPYLWDSVLYQKVIDEENIRLFLNCTCVDADTDGNRIMSVKAWQLTTYTWIKVNAAYFADCSGDSILAPIVDAAYRIGREAKSEFNEAMASHEGDSKTMGMSILIQARETDHKVAFTPPKWANVYKSDDDFAYIAYNEHHSSFRALTPGTDGCNFWWIELGGEDDSIHDTESIREELLKIAFGVWDHVKNYGDHGADNWDLEWIGFLPGKRESRRYEGDYILTQNDIMEGGTFEDIAAYGGWPLDDHNPAGMRNTSLNKNHSLMFPAPSPYGIPYRCLYSKNIENLFFAGRNISATHAALSSTRVMATCSVMGQAVGTAAAICVKENIAPREVYERKLQVLQESLMEQYCYLPGHIRKIPELSKRARVNLSKEKLDILFDGKERPYPNEDKHFIEVCPGETIAFEFDEPTEVQKLRMVFDIDFSRKSISDSLRIRKFALKFHEGKDFKPARMPKNLAKAFEVAIQDENGEAKVIYLTDKNHKDLIFLPVGYKIKKLMISFKEAWGDKNIHLFSCDIK